MLIDGVDVRDMTLADLARVVGVVSQETYLLHGTIRENLRHAKPDATDAEMEAAARRAQVHDVITALPDGYDTVVGARGHRFSGGEKQRLAIARTLLRDPRVLVLDEATSALDNETERAVQAALDEVEPRPDDDHHRAPALDGARRRRIVVLDAGRVVERGTTTRSWRAAAATPGWSGWPSARSSWPPEPLWTAKRAHTRRAPGALYATGELASSSLAARGCRGSVIALSASGGPGRPKCQPWP